MKIEHELKNQNVLSDIANTLQGIPDTVIEFALAPPGTSDFSRATYRRELNVAYLENLIGAECNVAFLNGLRPDLYHGECQGESKRVARNDDVLLKNIISVDCDFKDFVPNADKLSAQERLSLAESLIDEHEPSIVEELTKPWMVVFSGYGIHFHFKLEKPLRIDRHYQEGYKRLIDYLNGIIFKGRLVCDSSCSNAARIMRLPLSTNWKLADFPCQTQLLRYDPDADA